MGNPLGIFGGGSRQQVRVPEPEEDLTQIDPNRAAQLREAAKRRQAIFARRGRSSLRTDLPGRVFDPSQVNNTTVPTPPKPKPKKVKKVETALQKLKRVRGVFGGEQGGGSSQAERAEARSNVRGTGDGFGVGGDF
jgi:hypothetical protein